MIKLNSAYLLKINYKNIDIQHAFYYFLQFSLVFIISY